jgi:hypothetical protein
LVRLHGVDAGSKSQLIARPVLQMSRRVTIVLRVVAGLIGGTLVLELVLRVFATPGFVPVPRIAADSFGAPAVVHRQIEEGVAAARFTKFGARLTGNLPLRSRPPVVILGDSYVVAEQVEDGETMGAELERIARANGLPLDVRQYGWSGASPAQYLYVADEARHRWGPRRVIELTDNDLDFNALMLASPRLRVDSTGAARIVGAPIDTSPLPPRKSVLVMLLRHRWENVRRRLPRFIRSPWRATEATPDSSAAAPRESAPDSSELARTPAAVVGALAGAYGEALSLIYIATVSVDGDSVPSTIERQFLDACARHRVDCASTRDAMLASRALGHMSHGNGMSPLGNGHLNKWGHAAVANVMWDRLRRDRRGPAGGID